MCRGRGARILLHLHIRLYNGKDRLGPVRNPVL
jgi:hypothetical protein